MDELEDDDPSAAAFQTPTSLNPLPEASLGALSIDTYHAFNGPAGKNAAKRLLESDHTHPNEAGHQLIAHLLGQVPTDQLSQGSVVRDARWALVSKR